MEKKRLRMDFKVEWQVIDEERHVFKAMMVPDPDRYERRTINGKEGYFDKQDKLFFSDEVLASAAKTLAGKPIYAPPTTPDLEQYFGDAKRRIEQSLESEIQLDRELDQGNAYLNVNAGRELVFVVLYIDIVGSTELSRVLSPVAQRTLIPTFLREMTLLIDAYGGYAHKYTGDGLIAFFSTDPSSTVATDRAIDCAVAMRLLLVNVLNPLLKSRSYPTLQFRIGVDSGEIQIVDLGAKNVKSAPDLLGYTMNIAAKICSVCPPDKIVIGESVFRNLHVSRKKYFEELSLPKERWNYLDASTNRRYSVFVFAWSS
jgi:class 3 adenylate cyclase